MKIILTSREFDNCNQVYVIDDREEFNEEFNSKFLKHEITEYRTPYLSSILVWYPAY